MITTKTKRERVTRKMGLPSPDALTERYNKNAELFALLEEYEERQQQEAFAAYRRMRAKRKLHDYLISA